MLLLFIRAWLVCAEHKRSSGIILIHIEALRIRIGF